MFLFRCPSEADWRFTALVCFGFALIAVPTALVTGVYRWAPDLFDLELLRVALIALVLPALLEELVFRGPLIWVLEKRGRVPIWMVLISLAAFVGWHPVNAFTLMPQAASTFLDPRFIFITALFGAAVTILALRTRSLWPAIVLHWILVVSWKGLFGAPSFL